MAGRERSQRRERALEVGEARPGVAVVGPEAGEIDVGEIEHVVGLDPEERVAACVPGCVQHADAHAAAEIEDVAVAERLRVGPRDEVELLDDSLAEGGLHRLGIAVDRHHGVERTDAGQIRFVQMPGHAGEEVVAGDVVLVAMAVERRGPRAGSACARATRPSPGSITTVSSAPCTSSELPCGYLPPRAPKRTVTEPMRRSRRASPMGAPRYRASATGAICRRSSHAANAADEPGAAPRCGAPRARGHRLRVVPRADRRPAASAQTLAVATDSARRALAVFAATTLANHCGHARRRVASGAPLQALRPAEARRDPRGRGRGRDGCFCAAPHAHREPREVGRAERRRLDLRRAPHLASQGIREGGDEGSLRARPPSTRSGPGGSASASHDVGAALCDAFEHRAHDVLGACAARQAEYDRARAAVEPRRAEPLQCRHAHDAFGRRRARGDRIEVAGARRAVRDRRSHSIAAPAVMTVPSRQNARPRAASSQSASG